MLDTTKERTAGMFTGMGFDLEATGLDVTTNQMIEAGFSYGDKEPDHVVAITEAIPSHVTELTGWTPEETEEVGLDRFEALVVVHARLEMLEDTDIALVGHNLQFDLSTIQMEFIRHLGADMAFDFNPRTTGFRLFDTMILSRAVIPLGDHSLSGVADMLEIPIDKTKSHAAWHDAFVARLIAENLSDVELNGVRIGDYDPHDLNVAQSFLHHRHLERIRQYQIRDGADAVLGLDDLLWPINGKVDKAAMEL